MQHEHDQNTPSDQAAVHASEPATAGAAPVPTAAASNVPA